MAHDPHHSLPTIECDVCLSEIPISEAKCEEASDYVMYFCGLECYHKWQSQQVETERKIAEAHERKRAMHKTRSV